MAIDLEALFQEVFGPKKPWPEPEKQELDLRIKTDNGHIAIFGKFESLTINGKRVRFK